MEGNENTQGKPTAAPFPALDGVGMFTGTIRFIMPEYIEVGLKQSFVFGRLTAWHCLSRVSSPPRAPEHFIYSEQQTGKVVSFFLSELQRVKTLHPPPHPHVHLLHVILRTGDAGDLEISGGVGGSIQISTSEKRSSDYLAYLIDLQLQNSSTVTKPPAPPHSPTPTMTRRPAWYHLLIRHIRPHLVMSFFHRNSGQSKFYAACFTSELTLWEPPSTPQPARPPTPPSPTPTLCCCCCQPENQVQRALTTQAAKLIPPQKL